MQKIESILFKICMCLFVSLMFTACGDNHTYQTEWSKDSTYHWHACEDKGCDLVIDKAEHVWDEGTIITEARKDVNEKKIYTCTVCHTTKEEVTEFSGINEEEWNAMISPEVFTNYTLEYSGTVTQTSNDGEIYISDQSYIVKFTENKCYYYITIKLEGDEESFGGICTDEDFLRMKVNYETLFLAILDNYENYQYNSIDKVYEITKPIEVTYDLMDTNITISLSNSKVSISADGKLLTLSCEYFQSVEEIGVFTSDMTFIFKDYGTTVIPETVE